MTTIREPRPMKPQPEKPLSLLDASGCLCETAQVAECGCEIVGKRADGSPLPACQVLNFRYYGGRCAAD